MDKQREAARLAWEDRLKDEEIAAQLGINRRTLSRWKRLPHVQAEMQRLSEEMHQKGIQETLERARQFGKEMAARYFPPLPPMGDGSPRKRRRRRVSYW